MISVYDIPDLSPDEFARFAELIHQKASITLKEHKIVLLSNRLRRRLHELQLSDYESYYRYLQSGQDPEEMSRFFEVITTNETYFWRTTQNFELLKQDLMPAILADHPGREIHFWSAGCSSGEEPYNLAMELVEGMKQLGPFPFTIRASDLSERMVQFAREGRYQGRKIDRVPPAILRRYFREDEDNAGHYYVRADVKQRVAFHAENLFETRVGPFHCIFCRNVMIYFSRQDQLKLVSRFYEALLPGGYLVIGHSESLHMFDTPFETRQFANGVAYHKKRV
ncbi:MAG: hypothetical protein KDK39_13875 [Leptospiraceae bacterium]|nr:hypothetical protein [Leptospiraceae bacterium]